MNVCMYFKLDLSYSTKLQQKITPKNIIIKNVSVGELLPFFTGSQLRLPLKKAQLQESIIYNYFNRLRLHLKMPGFKLPTLKTF